MADYSITFARSARKELERLPDDIAARILDKVETLSQNPRPGGTTKLRGQKNLWRLRWEITGWFMRSTTKPKRWTFPSCGIGERFIATCKRAIRVADELGRLRESS